MAAACDPRDDSPLQPSAGRSEVPPLGELIGMFAATATRESMALVAGLAQLATLADDRVHAMGASAVDGVRLPGWLVNLGDATVDGAVLLGDVLGDGTNVMVGVRLVGGAALTLLVYVDHLAGHAATDGFAVPDDLHGVVGSYRDAAAVDGFDVGAEIEITPVDPVDAAAMLVEAISRGAMTVPPYETDSWPASRPLAEWVSRLAGEGGMSGFEWREWSDAELAQLEEVFVASEVGAAHCDGPARELVSALLWFATGYGHGDPYLWSPKRVEIFLCNWVPRKIIDSEDRLAVVPSLLRSFIAFAHRERGIAAELTDHTLAAVDAFEGEYLDLIADPHRPQGAVAIAQAALAMAHAENPDYGDARRALVGYAVGDDRVDAIPLEPLDDEPFDWDGIDPDITERISAVLGHIDRCCDELLDVEYRTAARRLLARSALGDPAVFRRRSRDDYTAIAVIWAIGHANGLFGGWLRSPRDQPQLLVKDLNAWFGVQSPNPSQRAATLLTAARLPTDPHSGLGDPSLLTSAHRNALTAYRDGIPYSDW